MAELCFLNTPATKSRTIPGSGFTFGTLIRWPKRPRAIQTEPAIPKMRPTMAIAIFYGRVIATRSLHVAMARRIRA